MAATTWTHTPAWTLELQSLYSHTFFQWVFIYSRTNFQPWQWPAELTKHGLLSHIQLLFIHTTASPLRLSSLFQIQVCFGA